MTETKASNDVIEDARALYARAKEAWSDIYNEAQSDLDFLSDRPGAQWDPNAYNSRISNGRPALQLDQLDKFINQVVNDEKMATPTIRIIPDGGEVAVEDAEVFQGIIRNIEYQSDADSVYDTAAESAAKCSIGFVEVDHEYEDDGFNQRLVLRRIVNALSVLLDPDSIAVDGSDAMYAFKEDILTVKQFKKSYPDCDPISFTEDPKVQAPTSEDQTVTIVEFFKIEEQSRTIGLLMGGETEEVQDGVEYVQTRDIKKRVVRRYKLSGQDILAETTFPGKYLPIIPTYGKEMWRDGKRHLHSLIRKAKPAQMLLNMWKSLETELLIRQPRSNFMAPELSVGDHANDWKKPDNAAVLLYRHVDDEGNPIPAPTPLPPPQFPQGVEIAAQGAIQSIKDAMGIYDASLGMRSNETSGIAIQRRQQEGDVATFHFADNRTKSIAQVGRVLLFAIPEVYDTPRVLQMIDTGENPKLIGVNGAMTEKQEKPVDLKTGKFTVKVTTGASMVTRRQEATQLLQEAVKGNPELWSIIGDLVFETMDMPGAQEIADRLRKKMDPTLFEDDEDPAVAALQMQLQQAQQALQMLQQELAAANKESQQKDTELVIKATEVENDFKIEKADLVLKEQQMQLDMQMKHIELEEKQLELQAKQLELQIKEIEAMAKIQTLNMQRENQAMEAHSENQPGEQTA